MTGESGAKKASITRSRKGCHNCKRSKIKCDERKPKCSYCLKTSADCDYSIKLTWGGRPYKDTKKRKEPAGQFMIHDESGSFKKRSKPSGSRKGAQTQFQTQPQTQPQPQPSSHPQITMNQMSGFIPMTPGDSVQSTINSSMINTQSEPKFQTYTVKQEPPLSEIWDSPRLTSGHETSGHETSGHETSEREMTSPPSFTTPQGVSLLSSLEDGQTVNGENDPQSIPNQIKSKPTGIPDDDETSKRNSDAFASLFSNMPDVSDGIESLSNALERVADGGHQFSLQNSEIFNKFLSSNTEERRPSNGELDGLTGLSPNFSLGRLPSPDKDGFSQLEDDFLNNYSTDLAKVDAYLPKQKANLVPDLMTSNPLLASFLKGTNTRRIRAIEELDDDEDSINTPLDIESSPLSAATSHIHFNLESIPMSLSPLPELLNQVPYYKQLMHFWVNVAADNLVPAPSHIYKENPFKVILPQMAMEYPAILTTILAFAATSMASITGKEASEEVVSQLISRSCSVLLKMLKDKDEAISDGTLATVLLLSCYESLSANNFEKHRAHTLGARQIVMARKLTLPAVEDDPLNDSPDSNSSKSSAVGLESDIAFFLMRWFVYVDVIGALSATKNAQYYLSNQESSAEYNPVESVNNLNGMDSEGMADPKRDIDYVLGFDVKFLPELTDIVVLIRKVNDYLDDPETDNNVLPLEIITKALEVKRSIMISFEKGEARRQARIEKMNNMTQEHFDSETRRSRTTKRFQNLIQQDNILRCTNQFFCDMGLLNLYRRVLRIPRESPIIQALANGIGKILQENITSTSSAEICSIFCLFCAACETLDDDMRQFFNSRFEALAQMGNVSAVKSLQIMNRCWQTGEDWIEASKILNIDITLL